MGGKPMSPKHHRARAFLARGVFDNLSAFSELEARISALPTKQERGDAFEAFAEAYLVTQTSAQAKQVWPGSSVPASVLRRLGLPWNDMGADGVFETRLDELTPYQVKFRTGRALLTWAELSTFMGLTDQATKRVLITNTDDLPSVMQERQRFHPVLGIHLDRLEKRDFDAIHQWLESSIVKHELKRPRKDQDKALATIVPALEQHKRVTTVMACGTGKTLIALWAAERLGCKTVLVLVPSLALVDQTLHYCLLETSWSEL